MNSSKWREEGAVFTLNAYAAFGAVAITTRGVAIGRNHVHKLDSLDKHRVDEWYFPLVVALEWNLQVVKLCLRLVAVLSNAFVVTCKHE